jgi:hypothetical protein
MGGMGPQRVSRQITLVPLSSGAAADAARAGARKPENQNPRRNYPLRPVITAAPLTQTSESLHVTGPRSVIIGPMSLAELLSGKLRRPGRLPDRLDELRGPARGIIVLPRHLSWPGMREFDVTNDPARRSMYGLVLTQGQRNDVKRFLNPGLLRQDWPLIATSLDPRLRRRCERRFALADRLPAGHRH